MGFDRCSVGKREQRGCYKWKVSHWRHGVKRRDHSSHVDNLAGTRVERPSIKAGYNYSILPLLEHQSSTVATSKWSLGSHGHQHFCLSCRTLQSVWVSIPWDPCDSLSSGWRPRQQDSKAKKVEHLGLGLIVYHKNCSALQLLKTIEIVVGEPQCVAHGILIYQKWFIENLFLTNQPKKKNRIVWNEADWWAV